MKKFAFLAATVAALAMTGTAHAGNPDGKLQVKLLGTGVLVDGKVTQVKSDGAGLVASGGVTDTRINDNVVPTVAIEYFFTPNVSVETICCVTGHHVTVAGGTLKGVVAVLMRHVRSSDVVGRLGGDEFALLYSVGRGTLAAEAELAAAREAIARPYHCDGQALQVGMSLGTALSLVDGTDPRQLLRRADQRLYADKAARKSAPDALPALAG